MNDGVPRLRHLVVVFGDQLNTGSAAFADFRRDRDMVWMAESAVEARHVWSSQQRIAFFFAAMRHFAQALRELGRPVHYRELGDDEASLWDLLTEDLARLQPRRVVCVQPGEWRVREGLVQVCRAAGVPLEVRPDRHFMDTPESFRRWAEGRSQIRLEHYYREMRRRHRVLLEPDGSPAGGAWNFDRENRCGFGKDGPPDIPPPLRFAPDPLTGEVLRLVRRRFASHPGNLASFGWPVTRAQALEALEDFIAHRLPLFGRYQDAMWSGEPFLFHALLSAALNVKLLDPREVLSRAEQAWREGAAPLAAVEGFIRQILGWREYVRGLYWWRMPGYAARNALGADQPLPVFYWDGETPLACLSEVVGQTLQHGYAHHIQRLMVTGLYGLLLGVDPRAMHEWYLAVYVDAVEWVELPNTLGMSQYADGGLMASKPYAATGKYIQRMSNYCARCPADPAAATGPRACPFTTLYWDFLLRHEERLRANPRMALQVRNAGRLSAEERAAIRARAAQVRADPACGGLFPVSSLF